MSGVFRINGYNSVRRINSKKPASGIIPTDIAGLKLWLDFSDASTLFTDAGSTPVSSDGDAIYQTNDKSGNDYHATRIESLYRPLYKINIQNGLSAGYFDGGSLDSTVPQPNPLSVYMVLRKIFSDRYARILTGVSSERGFTTHSGFVYMRESTTQATGIFDWGPAYLLCGQFNANDGRASFNNGEFTESLAIGTQTLTNARFGCREGGSLDSNNYVGYYHEVIFYNSILSVENDDAVKAYLNNKWAIY